MVEFMELRTEPIAITFLDRFIYIYIYISEKRIVKMVFILRKEVFSIERVIRFNINFVSNRY